MASVAVASGYRALGLKRVNVYDDIDLVAAAMQKAVNIALARHKALKQQVVVAGPDGQPRTVWVEELEAEAAARGEYLVYDVASPDGLAHPAA